MPLVTSPASPWESYPFRQHSVSSASASLSLGGNSTGATPGTGQQQSGAPHPKLNTQPSFRDFTMSPNSRGSMSSNGSTMVNSRGSLSSLGSIGTISSRASMASVGSVPSAESSGTSVVGNGSETSLNMWQHDDTNNVTPSSTKSGSVGSVMGAQSSMGAPVSLLVNGLPRDITPRECQYIFALATDLLSVDMSRNAVSGEVSLSAKFNSLHGAQQANLQIERRTDLFSGDVRTSIQSYTSPFVSQSNTPRSLYPSRPLFADSYWSQQPITPMSPSGAGADFISGSRRQSLISPTETVYSAGSIGQINLGPSSPSHHTHAEPAGTSSNGNTNVPVSSNSASTPATAAAVAAMSGSGSVSPGSNSVLSSTPTNGQAQTSASAIGTGVPLPSSSPSAAAVKSVSQRPSQASLTTQTPASHSQNSPQQGPSHLQMASHINTQNQQPLAEQNNPYSHQSHSQHQYNSDAQKIPPPNPADQNPPCNTLYVGNLPPDTSEAELKELFSQQAGYRRLCFRTKQNGPMCFVEFEDERLAGKALGELYGHVLSNSVKGGIRLSYSKNPLGVRSRPARR